MTIEGFVVLAGITFAILFVGELLAWICDKVFHWIYGPYPYTFEKTGVKYDITSSGVIKVDIKSLVASDAFKRQMKACERIRKRQKVKVRFFTPGE